MNKGATLKSVTEKKKSNGAVRLLSVDKGWHGSVSRVNTSSLLISEVASKQTSDSLKNVDRTHKIPYLPKLCLMMGEKKCLLNKTQKVPLKEICSNLAHAATLAQLYSSVYLITVSPPQ